MDKYLQIAKQGFDFGEKSWYQPPVFFTRDNNLYVRFWFTRDIEGGTELGNNSEVSGLPEFQFLLENSAGFSVDVVFSVDFKVVKDFFGKMYLSFWEMSDFPEDFNGVVYPAKKSKVSEFSLECKNTNLEESVRFSKLDKKVRKFFGKIPGFYFPENNLPEINDDDVRIRGNFPLENYSLRFLGNDLREFQEIIKLSDYFGVTAEIVEREFCLQFVFGVFDVRF